ncbi:hypothetical protein ACFPOE_17505 [Caenimonas terrae]|uniref:Uncharacterized protein n=1 Tax=Caenimonas terrae TaxID=696074 RepID=A0ABW0NH80_9BURK
MEPIVKAPLPHPGAPDQPGARSGVGAAHASRRLVEDAYDRLAAARKVLQRARDLAPARRPGVIERPAMPRQ